MQSGLHGRTGKYVPIIKTELSRFGIPLPVELVQAVIDIESGGVPGIVNQKSGATGLGQVMPVVVKDFNKAHGTNITMADLRGKDSTSIELQIRIAVWILGRFWKGAYNYLSKRLDDVPIDELTKIADLFYVAGPGATKKKLNKLTTPTFAGLKSIYPKWNAFPHVERLFKRIDDPSGWDLSSISSWLHSPGLKARFEREPKLAALLAIIALYLGVMYLFKKIK